VGGRHGAPASIDLSGEVPIIRTAVFDATTRVEYEQDLRAVRRTAEESLHRVTILERAASALTSATTSAAVEAVLGEAASNATGATAIARIVSAAEPGWEEHRLTMPIAGADGDAALVWDFDRTVDADDHLEALFTALGQQAALVLDRVKLLDHIEHQAMHDELTGLPNRMFLRARLAEAVSAAHRHGTALSVLFLDLDGFKAINDTLGHPAGDTTLQVVADRFLGVVRTEDIVGRLGGDEFVVLCEQTDADAAMIVAERLVEVTAEPLPGRLRDARLSASIGLVTAQPTADGGEPFTLDHLVRLADEAMYEAKRGRHGIRTRRA
jgi:diguanylate cyclase (GGDEF)-like protein